jgi:hypothetical protein
VLVWLAQLLTGAAGAVNLLVLVLLVLTRVTNAAD